MEEIVSFSSENNEASRPNIAEDARAILTTLLVFNGRYHTFEAYLNSVTDSELNPTMPVGGDYEKYGCNEHTQSALNLLHALRNVMQGNDILPPRQYNALQNAETIIDAEIRWAERCNASGNYHPCGIVSESAITALERLKPQLKQLEVALEKIKQEDRQTQQEQKPIRSAQAGFHLRKIFQRGASSTRQCP